MKGKGNWAQTIVGRRALQMDNAIRPSMTLHGKADIVATNIPATRPQDLRPSIRRKRLLLQEAVGWERAVRYVISAVNCLGHFSTWRTNFAAAAAQKCYHNQTTGGVASASYSEARFREKVTRSERERDSHC